MKAQLDLQKQLFGLVCATVVNSSYGAKKRNWKPSDFVGGGEEKKPSVAQQIAAFFGAKRESGRGADNRGTGSQAQRG